MKVVGSWCLSIPMSVAPQKAPSIEFSLIDFLRPLHVVSARFVSGQILNNNFQTRPEPGREADTEFRINCPFKRQKDIAATMCNFKLYWPYFLEGPIQPAGSNAEVRLVGCNVVDAMMSSRKDDMVLLQE